MDVAEWQKRLEDNFSFRGRIDRNLLEVYKMEKAYGEYLNNTFHGQRVLINSFQDYFVETIHCALDWVNQNGWPDKCKNYPVILLYYVTMFKSFRACENLLRTGYPLDGYALMRDLKDRSIFLVGIAHNIVSFPSMQGYD
ncbi:MAG: hypothetical protein ABIN18_24090 [Pseudomonadota bacterium]